MMEAKMDQNQEQIQQQEPNQESTLESTYEQFVQPEPEPEPNRYAFEEIVAELCQIFGWSVPNILVNLSANVIARLQACYLDYPIQPNAILTQKQWQNARNEGIIFSIFTLGDILKTHLGPDGMEARDKRIHSQFLDIVRPKLESPVEGVAVRRLDLGDQLKLEQALWKQLKEAMMICAMIQKMMNSRPKEAQSQPFSGLPKSYPQSVPSSGQGFKKDGKKNNGREDWRVGLRDRHK